MINSLKNKENMGEEISILNLWCTLWRALHYASILRTGDVAEAYYFQDQIPNKTKTKQQRNTNYLPR